MIKQYKCKSLDALIISLIIAYFNELNSEKFVFETACEKLLEPVRQRTFCIMGLQVI